MIVMGDGSILYECLVSLYLFLGFGDCDVESSARSHPVKADTRFLVEVGHLTVFGDLLEVEWSILDRAPGFEVDRLKMLG